MDVPLSIDQAIKHSTSSWVSDIHLQKTLHQHSKSIMAEQTLSKLKFRVEKLCVAIDEEDDGNLPGRDDLEKIRGVLEEIKGRTTDEDGKKDGDEQQLLPQSKREELDKLLPQIERALNQRKQQWKRQEPEAEHTADKKLLAAIGCNPFKPRPSQQQQQQKEEEGEAVSLKLLLRLTQNVLEPEQYYEWTTSYVDESRIYGWDKEADDVAGALVAAEDGESLFRAAGIAGVHGSGKTALAQKVFVHDKAKDNFALRLWVCVGPPDQEDRFGLLYRMLDNLGLDTGRVEREVNKSKVVKESRDKAKARIEEEAADKTRVQDDQKNIKDATKKDEGTVPAEDGAGEQPPKEVEESPEVEKSKTDDQKNIKDATKKDEGTDTAEGGAGEQPPKEVEESPEVEKSKIDDQKNIKDATKKDEGTVPAEDGAGEQPPKEVEESPEVDKSKTDDQKNIKDATKKDEGTDTAEDGAGEQPPKEVEESPEVEKSKIGVLLYILHMTLSKTSYMIVFDDIRAYGDDGWYSNLTLPPPPKGEWGDRLGYGLPKGKHRGAVLVTCRNEDDARSMVRTGRVVRPPRLELDDAWKLFRREYGQAKDAKRKKDGKGDGGNGKDLLLTKLEDMKKEIVNKCLGLPVAIAEAARGFAGLEPLPDMQPAAQEESKTAQEESKAAEEESKAAEEESKAAEKESEDAAEEESQD